MTCAPREGVEWATVSHRLVVVNREGVRVGKGGGFSDLEVAFLVEAGVLGPDTVLATTVHPLQVVDEPLPETVHDFRVDLIATPDAVIWCGQPRRPPGILWEHLHRDKIAAIPVQVLPEDPGGPPGLPA